MSTSTTKRPFWESKNEAFVAATPACDFLHPECSLSEPGTSLTETHYLGFNIPEERIHGLCYLWYHPNLKTVTGGVWAWQGVKRHNLQSELFDFVTFMGDDCLKNDLHDVQLDNSYRITTVEPLKRHRIRYADDARQNSFDIAYEAMMPAMVLASGMHLEQGMKTRGRLTLRGKDYTVNGYTVRDRSWGQLRSEAHQFHPPMAWMTCVFNDGFAFGCTAFDNPETDPEWKGLLDVPGGQTVKGGWVWQDGELTPVVSAMKKTRRNADTLFPESVEMTITDAKGRHFTLRGDIIAAANWRTWHNFDSIICLTRWQCEGLVSHGDFQECHWSEYVRLMHR
jgi:hypothetical protein